MWIITSNDKLYILINIAEIVYVIAEDRCNDLYICNICIIWCTLFQGNAINVYTIMPKEVSDSAEDQHTRTNTLACHVMANALSGEILMDVSTFL